MTERTSINILDFRASESHSKRESRRELADVGPDWGVDPARATAEDLDRQLTNLFSYVKDIVEAGADHEDIIKMNVWLKDHNDRELLNKHWIQMFPDENARPARHTQQLWATQSAGALRHRRCVHVSDSAHSILNAQISGL